MNVFYEVLKYDIVLLYIWWESNVTNIFVVLGSYVVNNMQHLWNVKLSILPW